MTADLGTGSSRGWTALRGDPIPTNPLRAVVSPYLWLAAVHLCSDLFVGIVTGTVILTLLTLAVGLAVLIPLSLPLWILTIGAATGLGAVERERFRLTLGVDIPAPRLPPRELTLGYLGRISVSGTVWRQIAYHLLLPVVGTVTFTVTVGALALPVSLMLLPVFYRLLPGRHSVLGLFPVTGLGSALAAAAFGLTLLVLVSTNLIRSLAAADAAFGRALLGPYSSVELATRVGQLEERRRQVVDSAEAERRRIERDLHDGAQQRLVALAMVLGRARAKLGDASVGDGGGGTGSDRDPAGIAALVAEAHEEAKQAITELRNLTRGIHPPVLTDRGLDAALSGLAARLQIPVEVRIDVAARPSATIESIAYFVVAEALTNITKHASARAASVVVRRPAGGGTVAITVTDDGAGGADPAGGTGLAGLADRVAGVDGHFDLSSPAGGPTVLRVELPCA